METQSANELRKREKRLEARVELAAKSLDAVAVKVGKEASKNEQAIDRIIATMLKGKHEREAMSRAHLAECAALHEKLQGLLDSVVEKRSSSMPALSNSVEQRLVEVRTAVLAEVQALKSRPGGLSGLSSRFGNVDPVLQEPLEDHDAAMKLSDDRLNMAVQYKFDQVHQALLREKKAREDDAEHVLALYETMLSEVGEQQRKERREQEAAEVELLVAVRELALLFQTQ